VPSVVAGLLAVMHPHQRPMLLLAVERARCARGTASAAVAGVVASLALSVALTVMVASFRDAVSLWLQAVLPADLYLRSASTNAGGGERGTLNEELVERIRALPGVVRLQPARSLALSLRADRPPVALFARPLPDPAQALPLVGDALAPVPGEIGAWVSEPAAAIHALSPGDRLILPLAGGPLAVRVRGVWRDYARQFGAIAIDLDDYRRATGDRRINDLALWLAPGASASALTDAARALVGESMLLDAATTAELRRISLAIFDRSFAVTVYLQAVAIAVGLVGIAASLSAQVLARRKEFGLLTHLGLTRRQILGLVAGETLAWLVAGTLLGLATGAAVALLLVKVVNPQSFHWTMDLVLPAGRLAALAAGVLVAGTLTAWLSARGAGGASAVMAVKEDW
jgi:putative ABC transport system permease protein